MLPMQQLWPPWPLC